MSEKPNCSACGGSEHMGISFWHGGKLPICGPFFMVWYDPDEAIDQTDLKAVGALSLKLKAQGKFPWVGEFASALTTEPRP